MAKTSSTPRPEPGDVFWVHLDPTQGAEKRKTRPCVVLTPPIKLGLVVVVPTTDAEGIRVAPSFVPVPRWKEIGFAKPVVVDAFQLRCVDIGARLGAHIGRLDDETLDAVRKRVALVLGLTEKHFT